MVDKIAAMVTTVAKVFTMNPFVIDINLTILKESKLYLKVTE